MNDLRHVSNERLDRIESDTRGMLKSGDVPLHTTGQALDDIRREKERREIEQY